MVELMAPQIISRAANDLRAPRGSTPLDLSSVTTVTVHHTAGPAGQSWREIQWAAMSDPSYVDSHYHWGIGGPQGSGTLNELRGDNNRGAHDGVNDGYGIVFNGTYAVSLPPQEALDTLVWKIRERQDALGRTLKVIGHRDRMSTTCPGDRLYRWVVRDLPTLLGEDPPPTRPTVPAPGLERAFPLPPSHYFGPADWGNQSVSGLYKRWFGGRTARQWLREWTRQLKRRGWPAGRGLRYLTGHGNDGIYGNEYRELVVAFQRDQGMTADGLLGRLTWDAAYLNPVV